METIHKTKGLWSREVPFGGGDVAFLDFRLERQALPRGSSPLTAFGGPVIDGQYWSPEEIQEFIKTLGWSAKMICVFEYVRSTAD